MRERVVFLERRQTAYWCASFHTIVGLASARSAVAWMRRKASAAAYTYVAVEKARLTWCLLPKKFVSAMSVEKLGEVRIVATNWNRFSVVG